MLLLLLTTTTCLQAQPGSWSNIGGNWQKNGYADVAGPATDSMLWETSSTGIFGAPLYIEGNHLVTMRFRTTTNAPVECYDLTTGNLLWSVDVTNFSGRSLPVGFRDGRIMVVRLTESQSDSLYALSVADGSRIWTSQVTVAPYISESGVFDSTGNFYIHGQFRTYKINPVNGQMIWQTTTLPMASGSGEMAINQQLNTGYVLENNGGQAYVWAINLTNGQKKYRQLVPELRPGGNVPQSALMVGNNGIVYVQLTEDNVAALSDDGTRLSLLWQTEIFGNCAFSTLCSGADGSVYAPSNGRIIRLDPLTGDILDSSVNMAQGGFFSPRISAAANNIIYATNGENRVYAFNLSLQLLWSDALNFTNTSGVCIAANGLAAVSGSQKIRVYTPTVISHTQDVEDTRLRIYPNPATSYCTFEGSNDITGKAYWLTDAGGSRLQAGLVPATAIIPLDGLPAGVYFLRIEGVRKCFKISKIN